MKYSILFSLLFPLQVFALSIGNQVETKALESSCRILNVLSQSACSGTLISNQLVLTAAHCIPETPSESTLMTVGCGYEGGKFKETYSISEAYISESYDSKFIQTFEGSTDFGFLVLDRESKLTPTPLLGADYSDYFEKNWFMNLLYSFQDQSCEIQGFGMDQSWSSGKPTYSKQKVELRFSDVKKTAKKIFGNESTEDDFYNFLDQFFKNPLDEKLQSTLSKVGLEDVHLEIFTALKFSESEKDLKKEIEKLDNELDGVTKEDLENKSKIRDQMLRKILQAKKINYYAMPGDSGSGVVCVDAMSKEKRVFGVVSVKSNYYSKKSEAFVYTNEFDLINPHQAKRVWKKE